MTPQMFRIAVTDLMAGKWSYCCKCDKDGVMVPQGPNQWQCIECGLLIMAEKLEKDLFMADQELSPEEILRHTQYCIKLADERLREIMNPPPMTRRLKILIRIARLLRVEITGMGDLEEVKHGEENQGK